MMTYSLSEIRDGTGWPADARFELVRRGPSALERAAGALLDAEHLGTLDDNWGDLIDALREACPSIYCAACLFTFTGTDAEPVEVEVNGRRARMHQSCKLRADRYAAEDTERAR